MLISGIMIKNMERGIGFNFWGIGEFLERSDNTSRLLNVNYFSRMLKIKKFKCVYDTKILKRHTLINP